MANLLCHLESDQRQFGYPTRVTKFDPWYKRPVIVITDIVNNRMRILSPVSKTEGMPESLLRRMMQANFDTALDARYAIAKGVVWATFIHPLRALHDRQFVSAIGQRTKSLAR